MKFIFFLFVLINFQNVVCQNTTLVYECRKDSNQYVSNLKNIHNELYFQSGKIRELVGILICGNYSKREFEENHIYKLYGKGKALKVFHHDLENGLLQFNSFSNNDSSNIFLKHTFIKLNDNLGLFVNHSKHSYWLKNNNQFSRVYLKNKERLICPGELITFENKIYISKIDSLGNYINCYIDTHTGAIHELFPLHRQIFNIQYYENKLFFDSFDKLPSRHDVSYVFDGKKLIEICPINYDQIETTIRVITDNKVIYTVDTGKQKEIWEYNIDTRKNQLLIELNNDYINNFVFFNNKLYWTTKSTINYLSSYSFSNNSFEENIAPVLDVKSTIHVNEYELFFIARAYDGNFHLYSFDKMNKLKMICKENIKLKWDFYQSNSKLYFKAHTSEDEVALFQYNIIQKETKQLSESEDDFTFKITEFNHIPFFQITKNKQTNLYRLINDKLVLIKSAIYKHPYDSNNQNLIQINNELFFIVNNQDYVKDVYTQIWKTTIGSQKEVQNDSNPTIPIMRN